MLLGLWELTVAVGEHKAGAAHPLRHRHDLDEDGGEGEITPAVV
jgi:hypothetical protein